jgi:hypothetical protein
MIETLPFSRKLTDEETLLLHSMCMELAICLDDVKDDNDFEVPLHALEFSRMEFDEKIVALYQICQMAQSETTYPRMLWVDATLYAVLQHTSQDLDVCISANVPLFGCVEGEVMLGTMLHHP